MATESVTPAQQTLATPSTPLATPMDDPKDGVRYSPTYRPMYSPRYNAMYSPKNSPEQFPWRATQTHPPQGQSLSLTSSCLSRPLTVSLFGPPLVRTSPLLVTRSASLAASKSTPATCGLPRRLIRHQAPLCCTSTVDHEGTPIPGKKPFDLPILKLPKPPHVVSKLISRLGIHGVPALAANLGCAGIRLSKHQSASKQPAKKGGFISPGWIISLGLHWFFCWAQNAISKAEAAAQAQDSGERSGDKVQEETGDLDSNSGRRKRHWGTHALKWAGNLAQWVPNLAVIGNLCARAPESGVSRVLYNFNIMVYLADIFSRSRLYREGYLSKSRVRKGEVWRLFTNAFLHEDASHLSSNLGKLREDGPLAEAIFGREGFVALYVVSTLGSSVLSILFPGDTRSVGASGSVFGTLGGLSAIYCYQESHIQSAEWKNYLGELAGYTLAMQEAFPNPLQRINYAGHAGGYITGWLLVSATDLKNSKVGPEA